MKKLRSLLRILFVLIMLLCACVLIWQVPAGKNLGDNLAEVRSDLETARGRERKQQYEYDKALDDIRNAQLSLDVLLSQAEEAGSKLNAYNAEIKDLKAQIKELQQQIKEKKAAVGGEEETIE